MEGEKSRINNTTDLIVDRISDLPDFILGHILSFLPTNKAVATSILSKRWRFAWVTVHSLDFYELMEENDSEIEEELMEFVRFVNRVLLLNDVGSLNKFSLTCDHVSISPQIISWINTAITRNVRELNLSVGNVDMPTSLFSCESLQSLVLHDSTCIDDATAVCLPRLESLTIHRVSFESEEACENLIRGCPILHYLELYYIVDYMGGADDDFTCIISSASLRRLEMDFADRSKLKLKASSLEYLGLDGRMSGIFVEESLSSLVEVNFNLWLGEHDFPNNSIVEVVRVFDCAKILTLSTDVMQALSRATSSLSTEFKRLMKLEASTYCGSVQQFIQNSKNLEHLTIYQRSVWPDLHDHSRWTTPLEVPRCLSTSLRKVYFHDYNGSDDERDMICYMLKYGSVLEVMHISCNNKGDGEKLKLVKEICEFIRKSPVCKVQFF